MLLWQHWLHQLPADALEGRQQKLLAPAISRKTLLEHTLLGCLDFTMPLKFIAVHVWEASGCCCYDMQPPGMGCARSIILLLTFMYLFTLTLITCMYLLLTAYILIYIYIYIYIYTHRCNRQDGIEEPQAGTAAYTDVGCRRHVYDTSTDLCKHVPAGALKGWH